jgi:hypothetical protein
MALPARLRKAQTAAIYNLQVLMYNLQVFTMFTTCLQCLQRVSVYTEHESRVRRYNKVREASNRAAPHKIRASFKCPLNR